MAEFDVEERARLRRWRKCWSNSRRRFGVADQPGVHARCILDVGCGTGSLRPPAERLRTVRHRLSEGPQTASHIMREAHSR
jgi:hypothetical protein